MTLQWVSAPSFFVRSSDHSFYSSFHFGAREARGSVSEGWMLANSSGQRGQVQPFSPPGTCDECNAVSGRTIAPRGGSPAGHPMVAAQGSSERRQEARRQTARGRRRTVRLRSVGEKADVRGRHQTTAMRANSDNSPTGWRLVRLTDRTPAPQQGRRRGFPWQKRGYFCPCLKSGRGK